MASLAVSGLAKQLREQAAAGESTQSALGGYDNNRTVALVNDTFGTPQQLPPGVPMVRHTFVIGGGKGCRQKFQADLPKNITAALRAIGFQEDKSADTSASSAGTFKRQHDTGANLIYCHVFPRVVADTSRGGAGAGESKGEGDGGVLGLADLVSRPLNLCIHAEVGTFRQMVAVEVQSWSQKKNLLEELSAMRARHAEIMDKMVRRQTLEPVEERIFEVNVESLEEKCIWLKKVMKQQVGKMELTAHDLQRLIAQVDEKLAAGPGDKAATKLTARREMLAEIVPKADGFKGRAELLRLYVKLFDIQRQAGNTASVKQLTAIKGVEDLIAPLETGARGWFEEEETVAARIEALKAQARTMKPAPAKKKQPTSGRRPVANRVNASHGGWSTVAKKGGNRFAAFN